MPAIKIDATLVDVACDILAQSGDKLIIYQNVCIGVQTAPVETPVASTAVAKPDHTFNPLAFDAHLHDFLSQRPGSFFTAYQLTHYLGLSGQPQGGSLVSSSLRRLKDRQQIVGASNGDGKRLTLWRAA